MQVIDTRRALALVGSIALAVAAPLDAEALRPPDAVIEEMDRAVLAELRERGRELDRAPDRVYAMATKMVRPHFDLDHVARLIAGPAWRDATAPERVRFVAALEHYLVSSYARALLFVEPRTLKVTGPPLEVEPNNASLPMRVVMDDGTTFDADVRFRLDAGAWRIWDVRAGGISFVRQYRGDFGTEARVHGLSRCADTLEEISRRNEAELLDRLNRTGSVKAAR